MRYHYLYPMLDKLVRIFDDISKNARLQDLTQLALEEGIPFVKRISFGQQPTELKSFKVFDKKGTKRMLGILSRPARTFKGQIRFYDFLRTRDLETTTQSVIEVHCTDLAVDYFMIRPKGALDKMKGIFVSREKLYPELRSFHNLFEVSSDDTDGSYDIKKSALELLTDHPGLTCEAEGHYFLFYYRKKEMKVHEVMPVMEVAEEFVRLMCFDESEYFV